MKLELSYLIQAIIKLISFPVSLIKNKGVYNQTFDLNSHHLDTIVILSMLTMLHVQFLRVNVIRVIKYIYVSVRDLSFHHHLDHQQ